MANQRPGSGVPHNDRQIDGSRRKTPPVVVGECTPLLVWLLVAPVPESCVVTIGEILDGVPGGTVMPSPLLEGPHPLGITVNLNPEPPITACERSKPVSASRT